MILVDKAVWRVEVVIIKATGTSTCPSRHDESAHICGSPEDVGPCPYKQGSDWGRVRWQATGAGGVFDRIGPLKNGVAGAGFGVR